MFLLLACAGNGDGTDLEPQIIGTVTTEDSQSASADVEVYKAFGMDVDGKGLWYFASDPDATCDSVAEYLTDDQVDPAGIWGPGTCNLTMVVSDGSYAPGASWSMDTDDAWLVGHISVRCAMGDGAFEWGKRDAGSEDEDYFWTGVEWTGAPTDFQVTIEGAGEPDGYTITLDMDGYDGNYPTVIDSVAASGGVTGTIDAEWCNLYQAGVFPQ